MPDALFLDARAAVDSLTPLIWQQYVEWITHGPRDPIPSYPAAPLDLDEELLDKRPIGSRKRLAMAYGLANMMRGEEAGFSRAQAVVAAGLYRIWGLDAGPVLRLLATTRASVSARSLAVGVLEDHWADPAFQRAALVNVCMLAAAANALEALLQADSVEGGVRLLPADERGLLSALEEALGTPNGVVEAQRVLAPNNVVTMRILRRIQRR